MAGGRHYGIRCTSVPRALFDAMRTANNLREAVVDMDMAAAANLVSISQMSTYLEGHVGWDGVPQAREALTLADEHSLSPNETRLRLVWQRDAGLPRPLVNRALFDHHLEVVRVTGPDLPDRALVTRRIAGAYRRACWLPEGERTWSLVPPPWWGEPLTVDQVLAARGHR